MENEEIISTNGQLRDYAGKYSHDSLVEFMNLARADERERIELESVDRLGLFGNIINNI